jgi:hypothetical protein
VRQIILGQWSVRLQGNTFGYSPDPEESQSSNIERWSIGPSNSVMMQAEYARRHTDDLSPLEACGRMDKCHPVSNGRKLHEAEKTRCAFVVASCGAGKSGRRVVSAFIATAFAQDDAANATRQWRSVADQLRPKLPKLVTVMDDAKPDVLAYMTSLPSTGRRSTARTRWSASTARSSAAPRSSAPSSSNRTTNGPCGTPAT